jgi:tRNA(fMet)-specific endonuclease VapC
MTIVYMLDTNIASELIKPGRGIIGKKVKNYGLASLSISTVVAAELRFGYLKRGSARLSDLVEDAIGFLNVLPFDEPASAEYAAVRLELENRGKPIGPNDLFIAAHARSLDLTLVTDNIREFSRVDGLKLENWIEREPSDV